MFLEFLQVTHSGNLACSIWWELSLGNRRQDTSFEKILVQWRKYLSKTSNYREAREDKCCTSGVSFWFPGSSCQMFFLPTLDHCSRCLLSSKGVDFFLSFHFAANGSMCVLLSIMRTETSKFKMMRGNFMPRRKKLELSLASTIGNHFIRLRFLCCYGAKYHPAMLLMWWKLGTSCFPLI